MPVKIRFRRGTAAEWTAANPVLALAEVGLETDTRKLKFGDAKTPWNGLFYGEGSDTAVAAEAKTRAASDATEAAARIAGDAAETAARIAALAALVGLTAGGTTGQALVKLSNTDYHTAWATISGVASSTFVEVSIVAGENLAAYDPVTSLGMKADSANPSAGFGRVIGLASAAILNGFSGTVIEIGEITNPAWTWTPGDPIFLSGTTLSSTAPVTGFVQQVGTAKSATEIVVDIGLPMLL